MKKKMKIGATKMPRRRAVFFLFSHQDVILLPIVCTLKNILHPISVIGYVFMHYYPHPSSYDF